MLFAIALSAATASATQAQPKGMCDRVVSAKGEIVALSMYGGKGAVVPYGLAGDQDGAHVVSVNGTGTSRVTLVLTSYEATIWDLSNVADRVAGVIAHGQFPQAIAGLSASVPVSFFSREQSTGSPDRCFIKYAYDDIDEIDEQAKHIEATLGRHPVRWYGRYAPTSFDIDGSGQYLPPKAPALRSVRAGVKIKAVGLMPGNDGLEQMVAAGFLRRFSKADVDAWIARGGKLSTTDRFALIAASEGHDPLDELGSVSTGYLVLKSIAQVPAGLAGANAVTFVLPEGVTMPTGAGHSTIYLLTGYPDGIPKASRTVAVDDRTRRIAEQAEVFDAAKAFVVWDEEGNVLHSGGISGAGKSPERAHVQSSQVEGIRGPRDDAMTIAVWLIGMLVLLGVAVAILWVRVRELTTRRKFDQFKAETENEDRARTVLSSLNLNRLKASVQQAIDVSCEDITTLSLVRFRRMIDHAFNDPMYDTDLGDELSAIIDRHAINAIAAYLVAARRSFGEARSANERDLRLGVERLTSRIEELAQQQLKRDSDRIREQRDFIRVRHPAADEDLANTL